MCVKIGIVDNDPMTILALKLLFQQQSKYKVLWTEESGRNTIRRCSSKTTKLDILLVDMMLSDFNGEIVIKEIRTQTPYPAILAITSYPLHMYATKAAEAGAQGIVSKGNFSEIQQGIDSIKEIGIYNYETSETLFRKSEIAFEQMHHKQNVTVEKILTYNEMKILELSLNGYSYTQIANILDVTSTTIRTYAMQARRKLDAHNMSEATSMWMSIRGAFPEVLL